MTSLWQSVLRTRRVPRLGTLRKSIPRPRNAELSPFWQLANSPSCLQNSMFVDPERRPLAVARSFKYQSPPGANPELQDGVALRKPGPHHAALVLAYRPRLCEREAAWCERRVGVHVAKSGMPL